MTAALRHYCRHDRTKLTEPTENLRRAFCCRGCFNSFYRSRCRVCGQPFRRKTEWQKTCVAQKCKAEIRRFPLAYSWPEKRGKGKSPSNDGRPPSNAHSTGIKFGLKGNPPPARCLREWWWGNPVDGDLSLYNQDDLTVVRVLEGGRYWLAYPHTTPTLSWPDDDLDLVKHRAESIALNALSLDAGTAARWAKDNATPHPMGPPLNRQPTEVGSATAIKFKHHGLWSDDLEIPDFLRRRGANSAVTEAPSLVPEQPDMQADIAEAKQ
jgi:hypothetical protein